MPTFPDINAFVSDDTRGWTRVSAEMKLVSVFITVHFTPCWVIRPSHLWHLPSALSWKKIDAICNRLDVSVYSVICQVFDVGMFYKRRRCLINSCLAGPFNVRYAKNSLSMDRLMRYRCCAAVFINYNKWEWTEVIERWQDGTQSVLYVRRIFHQHTQWAYRRAINQFQWYSYKKINYRPTYIQRVDNAHNSHTQGLNLRRSRTCHVVSK